MNGLVVCPKCGWRGVPTYVKGRAQRLCPACRKADLEDAPDGD